MSNPQLVLVNQFGEESINQVTSSTGGNVPAATVANGSLIGNFSGSTGYPIALTTQAVANKLPAKTGVTAIGAETSAGAVSITLSTGDMYTDAAVNTAVNAALATVVSDMNATITKVNAILAALKVVS